MAFLAQMYWRMRSSG